MRSYLAIDCDYLGRSAHAKMANLSRGALYGFLLRLRSFLNEFGDMTPLFCFDSRHLLREEIYPDYKSTRKKKRAKADPEEKERERRYRSQMTQLRKQILPELGFSNVIHCDGFEADDHLAQICKQRPRSSILIVATDHDLYQLLSANVSMFKPNPGNIYDQSDFEKEFGISPIQWSEVKAIAGCSSDDIRGVCRVGESTACKFLTGEINSGRKFDAINGFLGTEYYALNQRLVELPFEGTPKIRIKKQNTQHAKNWRRVMKSLKFPSLVDPAPGSFV